MVSRVAIRLQCKPAAADRHNRQVIRDNITAEESRWPVEHRCAHGVSLQPTVDGALASVVDATVTLPNGSRQPQCDWSVSAPEASDSGDG